MNLLSVSSSPHIRTNDDTPIIMLDVIIALMPALIAAVYFFGYRAMVITIITIASSLAFEHLWAVAFKKPTTIYDLSAIVSGMLLAFNLPVTVPLWLPVVGSFFMIIIVKMCFGGLGKNLANPAITARVVLLLAFPTIMTAWTNIGTTLNLFSNPDIISSATPLALIKGGVSAGTTLPSYLNMFLGGVGGCIGETSVLALLIGAGYLFYRKIITWRIPLTFIASLGVFTYIFGGATPFMGNFMYHILAGGLMLGAFYMATDYSTSPVTPMGQIYYGIGCGVIASIIRLWGGYPEGVSFAILIMNVATPLIEKMTPPRRFGSQMKKFSEYLKLVVILLAIPLIVALALNAVNFFAKDKANQNPQSQTGENTISDANQNGTQVSLIPSGNTSVVKIIEQTLANGEKAYLVSCKPKGYNDAISMTVELNSTLNVTSVKITSINDTPGLGARANEPSFLNQFTGKGAGVSVTKDTPNGNQIQAISGATITSRALAKGVNDAISEVQAIVKAQPTTPVTTASPTATPSPTTTTTSTATVAPKPTQATTPTATPSPTITQNTQTKTGTTSYTPSGNTSVSKISKTVLANGQVSYSVSCSPMGYEDVISMTVGLDGNLNVTSVKITSINDTPGRGSKVQSSSFLSQFTGKIAGVSVTRGTPNGNQIQAISGATITSRAVAKGVNDAISEAQAVAKR